MCSNIFCISPDEVEAVYFGILLTTNLLNCLIAIASIYRIISRTIYMRQRAFTRSPMLPHHTPAVSAILPCYLPNECEIVEATIEHILLTLESDAPVTLWLVYNTPHKIPMQARLRALDGRTYAPGRTLRVVEAIGSSSKAENLNVVLKQITDPFVALYDADHRPDRGSLQLMMQTLLRSRACAVQGSTYIRGAASSILGRAVNAEFFVTHFVYFPAMQVLSGTGYFGGSNALWRTDVLRKYGFDSSMHCEDVDLSARVILDGHRISFCPRASSGELTPAGNKALIQQRLRWFIGWEQVTRKYYWRVFGSSLGPPRKLGFCYMFHLRWYLLLAALMGAVINPVITSPFVYPLPTWSLAIQSCVYTAVSAYLFVAVLALCICVWHQPKRPSAWFSVCAFFLFSWLYVALHFSLQTIALMQVLSGRVGEWKVTQRSVDCTLPVGTEGKADEEESFVQRGGHVGSASLKPLKELLLPPSQPPAMRRPV
uniref:Glycosyltransferase 2-like domain-containing protein n=2 Tax=Coccolithus braarudii TaxID=221442 RepID=A0A7S0PXD1_9EUKA|mmetsp:Transcript_11097/g.24217  ORF Transcript_11097/g.24217 Transcript_11097/m.24217 type:complete len:485 (+) Transcript_11097:150-1604(+)